MGMHILRATAFRRQRKAALRIFQCVAYDIVDGRITGTSTSSISSSTPTVRMAEVCPTTSARRGEATHRSDRLETANCLSSSPSPRPVASLDRLITVCGSRPDLGRSSAYGDALLFHKFYDPGLCS